VALVSNESMWTGVVSIKGQPDIAPDGRYELTWSEIFPENWRDIFFKYRCQTTIKNVREEYGLNPFTGAPEPIRTSPLPKDSLEDGVNRQRLIGTLKNWT
jgi:hypothetical protein